MSKQQTNVVGLVFCHEVAVISTTGTPIHARSAHRTPPTLTQTTHSTRHLLCRMRLRRCGLCTLSISAALLAVSTQGCSIVLSHRMARLDMSASTAGCIMAHPSKRQQSPSTIKNSSSTTPPQPSFSAVPASSTLPPGYVMPQAFECVNPSFRDCALPKHVRSICQCKSRRQLYSPVLSVLLSVLPERSFLQGMLSPITARMSVNQ